MSKYEYLCLYNIFTLFIFVVTGQAEFYQQRMTIAQARYQPNEDEVIKSQVKLSDDPTGRTKRPTVHDLDNAQAYQGRSKRGTRVKQTNDEYYDSSDSDEARILQRGHQNNRDSRGFDTLPVYVEEFKNDQLIIPPIYTLYIFYLPIACNHNINVLSPLACDCTYI